MAGFFLPLVLYFVRRCFLFAAESEEELSDSGSEMRGAEELVPTENPSADSPAEAPLEDEVLPIEAFVSL